MLILDDTSCWWWRVFHLERLKEWIWCGGWGRCFTPQEAPAHTIIDRLGKTSSFSSSSLLSPHCDHHFMRPMMICSHGITCQLNHQILEALFHGTGSTRTHTGYYWSIEQHIILIFFIITISHIVSLSGQGKFCSYPHSISKSSWLVRNCFVGIRYTQFCLVNIFSWLLVKVTLVPCCTVTSFLFACSMWRLLAIQEGPAKKSS